MQKFISAHWIFPVSSAPLKGGVIEVDEGGRIVALYEALEATARGIEPDFYEGSIVPGFVNTHCHLELSHLKGAIAEKTGLPRFVSQIVALRDQEDWQSATAMEHADREMEAAGIVAVGDISNRLDSKRVKEKSGLFYHTFIELFTFDQPAKPAMKNGQALKSQFAPLKSSLVPHAPYSVSEELLEAIRGQQKTGDLQSIHNQETASENTFFQSARGELADGFAAKGLTIPKAGTGISTSLHYHLPLMNPSLPVLLVHNTFTDRTAVEYAVGTHPQLYWCLCPNANLYIEDRLPDIALLRKMGQRITLGTDSLASNHQLSIWEEIKTIRRFFDIPVEELLQWATLNGASFLGISSEFGSLEVGKKPGIVWLSHTAGEEVLQAEKVTRLY